MLIKKSLILENISLADFLGAENSNISCLTAAFPESKIVSRGDEIVMQGSEKDIVRIADILNALINHFHLYGRITEENVKHYTANGDSAIRTPNIGEKLLLHGNRGTPIKPRTINQQNLVEAVENNDLVFALGPAGTGKTYVSVALAVRALKNKHVKKIIITRPAVEAGERLGFLPGDLKEKIDPYLRPIYDALHDMLSFEKVTYYIERSIIEIVPLAYMRGRTLHNGFIIVDEAQNTTPVQMKMVLTRMGPASKMIVTGDTSQIDLPANQPSGLNDAARILSHTPKIGFVSFTHRDVIRHALVKDIIQAYQRSDTDSKTH